MIGAVSEVVWRSEDIIRMTPTTEHYCETQAEGPPAFKLAKRALAFAESMCLRPGKKVTVIVKVEDLLE